jgi:hypothetical protein
VGTAAANATSFDDIGTLNEATAYQYYVVATDSPTTGNSAPSATASATTATFAELDSLWGGSDYVLPNVDNAYVTPALFGYVQDPVDHHWIADHRDWEATAVDGQVLAAVNHQADAFVIDIEMSGAPDSYYSIGDDSWGVNYATDGHATVEATIDKFTSLIDYIRDRLDYYGRSDMRVAIYGYPVFPVSADQQNDAQAVADNKLVNDFWAGWYNGTYRPQYDVISKLDFLAPSVYSMYEDQDEWAIGTNQLMTQARQYGKPVYPFMSVNYLEWSNPSANHQINPNYDAGVFDAEIDTIRRLGDGVLFWGFPNAPFDSSSHWYDRSQNMPAAPGAAPSAPSSVSVSAGQVVSWTDNSADESGFQIERSADGGTTFNVVGITSANVTHWKDQSHFPIWPLVWHGGQSYVYRVRAFNGFGSSTAVSSNAAAVRDAYQINVAKNFDAGNNPQTTRADPS